MANPDQTVSHRSAPVVTYRYDPDSQRNISEAIIGALADAEGISMTEVTPVYETIDLDAVNNLFASYGGPPDSVLLSFNFENWDVFVRADGRIRICDGTRFVEPESASQDRAV